MATQKEVLKASIALKNGSEIEFEVIAEYSQHREHDDYTSWCETELWGSEIDCMTAEEAKEILENEIDCIFIEDLFGCDSDEDNIFGGRKEMLEMIKEIAKED